jgi:hypothetical protein
MNEPVPVLVTLGTVLIFGVAYLALAVVTLIAGIFYLPYWAWKHR